MAYSEAELKALTVVKLKELLAARSLAVTGKKDDLIARLVAHPDAPLTQDSTGPASAVDEPDGQGIATTAEATAAVDDPAPADPAREAARLEEDKRAARAARFGVQADLTAPADADAEADKKKRAERFGAQAQAGDAAGDDKLSKSLAALDAPLGSLKRQREPKVPNKTSKTAPAGEQGVVGAAAAAATKGGVAPADAAAEPAAAVAADPELKKRVEEEEEKKRKRLERFGPPAAAEAPQEKKTKVDA